MVPSSATPRLIEQAKLAARSLLGGGWQKKLNDLESYKSSGLKSGVSYGLSHVFIIGPTLAEAFKLAYGFGVEKLYQTWRANSKTSRERITNTTFVMELGLCSLMRQALNTIVEYLAATDPDKVKCTNCQDAFKEAKAACLAQDCIDDLKKALEIFHRLTVDLEKEIGEAAFEVNKRARDLQGRIDNFRDNHPDKACRPPGVHACYWLPQVQPIEFRTIGRPPSPPLRKPPG
jgi:hypothetical protein